MIHADSAKFDGQTHAASMDELAGVHFNRKSQVTGRLEKAARMLDRETAAVARGCSECGELAPVDDREHSVAEPVDIRVRRVLALRRYECSAEKSRNDIQRQLAQG